MDDLPAEVRQAVETQWAADLASQRLGMELVKVVPGQAVLRMPVAGWMVNGHGVCHGGFVFALADSAFAFAAGAYGSVTLAQHCDVVYIAPARTGDVLEAEATERSRQGRTTVVDVTVRRVPGEVVAEFRGLGRVMSQRIVADEAP